MSISGPVFVGASHSTMRRSGKPVTAATVGANGRPGASSTSVTVIVTVTVSVPPFPSSALTTTV